MTRERLIELMNEAGFNTDWMAYADARETVEKYERLAQLIEQDVVVETGYTPPLDKEGLERRRTH